MLTLINDDEKRSDTTEAQIDPVAVTTRFGDGSDVSGEIVRMARDFGAGDWEIKKLLQFDSNLAHENLLRV